MIFSSVFFTGHGIYKTVGLGADTKNTRGSPSAYQRHISINSYTNTSL